MGTLKFAVRGSTLDNTAPQESLHTKYRPRSLAEVVGQEAVVKSLSAALGKARNHSYLLLGPSGTGKTTLARIAASMLGIDSKNVIEIDAATNSGVADMRGVAEIVGYRAMSGDGRKMVIVDECHALSKQTWQSLLKIMEEPPQHLYWALCTTEPDKVPETIRTRCLVYNLKAVDADDLSALLTKVRDAEGMKVPDTILEAAARAARGSPRRALMFLQQVEGIKDKAEALRLFESGVGEEEQAVQLARLICGGKGLTWASAMKLVSAMDKESPEGVRLVVVNYAASVLKGSQRPEPLLAVLDAFRGPYNPSEKWAPLYLSLGTLLFN